MNVELINPKDKEKDQLLETAVLVTHKYINTESLGFERPELISSYEFGLGTEEFSDVIGFDELTSVLALSDDETSRLIAPVGKTIRGSAMTSNCDLSVSLTWREQRKSMASVVVRRAST